MKRSTLELWVGIFVALGIAAVVFLSLRVAGGQTVSRHSSYTVSASFTDIGGLKVKAPVKASGVVVGRVSSIQLDPKTYRAKVSLDIDSQYRFSTDVSAEILTSGLLGEQYIGLQQGAEETELKNGDTIEITSSALVLEQLIGKFMTNTVEKNGTTQ
ncbi:MULTISPECIES: outer membrane lipid asymmetry maintenance protein MlaD [Eikenella]|uniref:Outer membrane lipid asymmetry maintenance protein MlaD n=1 Tax=Eikenella corrodens TaxID=539 RepID=A0A3S9SHW5_EIKCO|nr:MULTISPECIES: outer membrane lipid asymmetry maintenance protein MlaD [Eikenella]AZR59097.1 outer membrane lipid asymmetry maintenance protein MlaD [Eikenella corrodens]